MSAYTLKYHYTQPVQFLQGIGGLYFLIFAEFSGASAPFFGPFRLCSPARAAQDTVSAPASSKVRAQAAMVLPVVHTSSTRRNRRPRTRSGWGTV